MQALDDIIERFSLGWVRTTVASVAAFEDLRDMNVDELVDDALCQARAQVLALRSRAEENREEVENDEFMDWFDASSWRLADDVVDRVGVFCERLEDELVILRKRAEGHGGIAGVDRLELLSRSGELQAPGGWDDPVRKVIDQAYHVRAVGASEARETSYVVALFKEFLAECCEEHVASASPVDAIIGSSGEKLHGLESTSALRLSAAARAQAAHEILAPWVSAQVGEPLAMPRGAEPGMNEIERRRSDHGPVFVKFPSASGELVAKDDFRQQAVHEVAACIVASMMGRDYADMVAPCVLREVDGRMAVVSQEQPGDVAISCARRNVRDEHERRAALFDVVIGNGDRHKGNYLVTRTGKLRLIDHGLAFTEIVKSRYSGFAWNLINVPLTGEERDVLIGLRERLPEVRPMLTPQRYAALVSRVDTMIDRRLLTLD